jgi:hypothetical protein
MNDCKTRFGFRCPVNGMDVYGVFDHLSGRLDLHPPEGDLRLISPETWADTLAFCAEHEGNYFYLRDVRDALRGAGVDTADLPY